MNSAIKELLQQAFAHHQAGENQKAEALYRHVLTREPENLNALQLLGLLMHESGRDVDAVSMLHAAVVALNRLGNSNAQYAALYNNFGNALRAVGRGREAVEQYQRGLELDPTLAELHVNLGSELLGQGDLIGAIASYEAARGLGRISAKCLCSLAGAHAATGRMIEAQAAYREAFTSLIPVVYSQHPEIQAIRTLTSSTDLGQVGTDTSSFAKRQHKSDHIDAVAALVRILVDKRQPDLAVDVCSRLVEATPDDPDAHHVRGRMLCDIGDYQSAITAFRRCLGLNPNYRDALYDLSMALVRTGLERLAIPILEMALTIRPDDASCHVELGNILYSVGEKERAFGYFHRASSLRPLTTWAGANKGADFSVLLLCAPGAGNTPPHFLFGDTDFDRHFFALLPGVPPDIDLLRSHGDIVVNLISDVDQGREVLSTAANVIDALGKPTINHPRNILATGRDQISHLLSGIRWCRIPRTIRCTRDALVSPEANAYPRQQGLLLPLLLRVPGTHGGDALEKICEPDDVDRFLAQYPGDEYYASEYVDYQSYDGYFRKYRFVFTNDEILPYHLAIADQWKVHHFRTDMVRHSWMQDEERTFLENPQSVFSEQHYLALQEMRAAVGLEFFGVDCSLDRDGTIVVFEVNASMLVHNDNKDFPYKTPHCARVKEALESMLAHLVADTRRTPVPLQFQEEQGRAGHPASKLASASVTG